MGELDIVFNEAAFRELLASCEPVIAEATKRVEANAAALTDKPVKSMVFTGRNGRPTGYVTIMHPAGLAEQAKHGVLTKAAAEAGLDIRRYTQ